MRTKLLIDDAGLIACELHATRDGCWREMRTTDRVDYAAEMGCAPTCVVCAETAARVEVAS